MTRFYTDTIVTKFIKHLLSTTYLPTMNTWKPGDLIIEGLCYVTRDQVVRAKKTGCPQAVTTTWFDVLYPYSFGSFYRGVTCNFQSNIKGYDSQTHYVLGQYLRAIRDIEGVNLMPYYNCVNNEYLRGVSFDQEGYAHQKDSDVYNILCIPVKYDREYTVGFSCPIPIQYGFIFYNEVGYLPEATMQLSAELGMDQTRPGTRPQVFLRTTEMCSVENPTLISSPSLKDIIERGSLAAANYPSGKRSLFETVRAFAQYEKYLKLILKIPKSVTTTVTVLEGDYRASCQKSLIETPLGTQLPKPMTYRDGVALKDSKKEYISPYSQLSLLQFNDGITYPFSDRLIEYLLLNVIDPADTILGDIVRIQKYASSTKRRDPYVVDTAPGVWSDTLTKYLFNLTMDSTKLERKLDISGFVDRDVEKIVTEGFVPEWQDLTTL